MPEEARERVRASNYSKEAIERELNILWKIQEERHKEAQNAIKAEISKTKATIKATEARIEAYGKEIDALIARNKMLAESSKLSKKFGFDGITDEYGENYEEKNNEYIEYWKNLQKEAQEERAKLKQKRESLEQELKDVESSYNANRANISGAKGGTTNDSDNNYNNGNKGTRTGKTGNYDNTDYSQNVIRDKYQLLRNQLWYDGNIQAKQYNNSLKEITNNEELFGKTIEGIQAKGDLFKNYSVQLKIYEEKLKVFKTNLIKDLDDMMEKNTVLANKVGYSKTLTEDEKLKNIEVNKELYQQVKTYSKIVNLINETVQKLEDVKSKQIDISNQAKRNKEEYLKEQLDSITRRYNSLVTEQRGTAVSDVQKDKEKLSYLKELLAKQTEAMNESHNQWLKGKNKKDIKQDTLASFRKEYEERVRIVQETTAQIREIENQGVLGYVNTLRNSIQSNFSNMLVQGTSFKNAMKNIWNDLCSYVVQELLRVYVVEKLTGMLFRGFTGNGDNFADNLANTVVTAPRNHTGANIGVYPKMHTGGMVEKGRIGVMPKLSNDEVVRTLQVGEEVNSVKERRSNEILASVAMKAIDAKYQQPTNVNITALDSRSFAEYMNDNADILLAVLNKQGALGR